MKLPQNGDNVCMTCKGCVFAQHELFEENVQFGCVHGRIDKFHEQCSTVQIQDDNGVYYGLKRFCNLYRDQGWLDSIDGNAPKVAMDETKPTFGVVIYHDGKIKDNLESTINSLINVNYDKDKLFVVISSYARFGLTELINSSNLLKENGIDNSLVLNTTFDIRTRDYDAFSRCTNFSHIIKMSPIKMPEDLLIDIHNYLNVEMKRILLFRHKSIRCVPFPVMNNEYLKHEDFDAMLTSIENTAREMNMTMLL